MFQSIDASSQTPDTEDSHPQPGEGKAEVPALPPFLNYLTRAHVGKLVAVYTGQGSYVGRLISVTGVKIVLDSDSDALDGPALLAIDASRIEAVETPSG